MVSTYVYRFSLLLNSVLIIRQYCSGKCQRQDWSKHEIACTSPLRMTTWQPKWVSEARNPVQESPRFPTIIPQDAYNNPGYFPSDLLRAHKNEALQDGMTTETFRLCFVCTSKDGLHCNTRSLITRILTPHDRCIRYPCDP